MFTTTALITWALIALVTGFAAGWLVGLFRWKNSPNKPKEFVAAIKVDWQDIEKHVEDKIIELKQEWLAELKEPKTEEAQSDASKKP
ncbi:hypothetical protein GC087_21415 [Pantoea sp. JZ2]|uniref:hypothetical protein n=1 Tax=Pantoea sp. JZ2 TaxID=2654189 RepID=UPI002B4794AF|nr:hypothetical protein [Pantoea sp. JZ2]WRH14974.1 hypothetical protein GC087_21415 [Pantoea sp. JZ2]